jgi:hypothetical protein
MNMKSVVLSLAVLAISGNIHAAETVRTVALGPVVAEQRTFSVDLESCLKNLRIEGNSVVCIEDFVASSMTTQLVKSESFDTKVGSSTGMLVASETGYAFQG